MTQPSDEMNIGLLLKALRFAAEKHSRQRRKDAERSPYINHPIAVAELLWRVGKVRNLPTLLAAVLHDTVEDTGTSPDEIREQFGEEVLALVMEVTDDKSLPKATRKQLQIEHAPHISPRARQIKLADKINNVYDISHTPPADWTFERRREYLDWTEQVVSGLRGQNPELERCYDQILAEGRKLLSEEKTSNH